MIRKTVTRIHPKTLRYLFAKRTQSPALLEPDIADTTFMTSKSSPHNTAAATSKSPVAINSSPTEKGNIPVKLESIPLKPGNIRRMYMSHASRLIHAVRLSNMVSMSSISSILVALPKGSLFVLFVVIYLYTRLSP